MTLEQFEKAKKIVNEMATVNEQLEIWKESTSFSSTIRAVIPSGGSNACIHPGTTAAFRLANIRAYENSLSILRGKLAKISTDNNEPPADLHAPEIACDPFGPLPNKNY